MREHKSKPVVIPTGIRNSTFHYRAIEGFAPIIDLLHHRGGDAHWPLLYRPIRRCPSHSIRELVKASIFELRVTFSRCQHRDLRSILRESVNSCRHNESRNWGMSRQTCHAAYDLNWVLRKLARHGILVLTCPSHTWHLFQMLDVFLFAVLKPAKKYERRYDTSPVVVDHSLRLFRVYEKAMPRTTIRASWNKTDFDYERWDGATYLAINELNIRQSPEFRQIWEFDY
jgi:hypothetical protein